MTIVRWGGHCTSARIAQLALACTKFKPLAVHHALQAQSNPAPRQLLSLLCSVVSESGQDEAILRLLTLAHMGAGGRIPPPPFFLNESNIASHHQLLANVIGECVPE